MLVEALERDRLRCHACGHQCPIPDGATGVCKVRFNRGGRLFVPWGYVGGVQCDPVEKKPFFHAYPGALAYSFGMLGCDLHCGYCQNWVTSQALRDPEAIAPPRDATPASLVADAQRQVRGCWSHLQRAAHHRRVGGRDLSGGPRRGLVTGFVSNGNGTTRVLEYIRPHIDLYKVDLKSFDDRRYRELGGRLAPILDTIQWLHDAGVWVEIVTLLVPGFNDSERIARAHRVSRGVSPDIPWHVTAFHQDYKMTDPANTTPAMLLRAARIGQEAGLRYVYAGNQPGRVGDYEHTNCHACGTRLISRYGYLIQECDLTPDGACPLAAHPHSGPMECRVRRPDRGTSFQPHDRTTVDHLGLRIRNHTAGPVVRRQRRGLSA